MTENIENLILEHLRHIRAVLDKHDGYFAEIKHRLSILEISVAGIRRDLAQQEEMAAHQQLAFDKLSDRVERIERRLAIQD